MANQHTCRWPADVDRQSCNACRAELRRPGYDPFASLEAGLHEQHPPKTTYGHGETHHHQVSFDLQSLAKLGSAMPPSLRWVDHRFTRAQLPSPAGHLDDYPYAVELDLAITVLDTAPHPSDRCEMPPLPHEPLRERPAQQPSTNTHTSASGFRRSQPTSTVRLGTDSQHRARELNARTRPHAGNRALSLRRRDRTVAQSAKLEKQPHKATSTSSSEV